MNHVAHLELIRIHQAEQLRAADHHRLVRAARGTRRRLSVTQLRELFARVVPQPIRPGVEAEPCPP